MRKPGQKIEQYHLHKEHPEKLQFEMYDLKEYRRKNFQKAGVPHSHSYYQLIWFSKADGVHTVDFNNYQIQGNTILFTAKDQIHSFDEKLNIEGWLLHFNESFFMHNDVDVFLKYNIFSLKEEPCYVIKLETVKAATYYVELIQRELANRHLFGHEDIIRFLLKSLLINLERVHQKDSEKKLKLNSQYELQFFNYKELIENNYKRGLSVGDYANLLNISSKTLASITKKNVGKTPSQLIVERVVLEAKRLLKFTALQINEIAFQLGFEDPSYFVKYFKKKVGSSPRAFRSKVSK